MPMTHHTQTRHLHSSGDCCSWATQCHEQTVKANPRSKVYRGEREYGERRDTVNEAGKIRVKIAPGGQYLSLSGADVTPLLKRHAEKHGR